MKSTKLLTLGTPLIVMTAESCSEWKGVTEQQLAELGDSYLYILKMESNEHVYICTLESDGDYTVYWGDSWFSILCDFDVDATLIIEKLAESEILATESLSIHSTQETFIPTSILAIFDSAINGKHIRPITSNKNRILYQELGDEVPDFIWINVRPGNWRIFELSYRQNVTLQPYEVEGFKIDICRSNSTETTRLADVWLKILLQLSIQVH